MAVLRAGDAVQARGGRGMAFLQDEHLVGLRHRTAALHEVRQRRLQARDPDLRDVVGQDQEAVAEIIFPLRLGQHVGGVLPHFVS